MKSASVTFRFIVTFAACACLAISGQNSIAVIVPFMEDFNTNNAGWANFNSTAFATYNATGGPDGGAYLSGPRTLNGLSAGGTAIALRARHDDPWNSSGDAFAGNWRDTGARIITAWVRHDIPTPVNFFARAATAANFPGHIYAEGLGSDPNTWNDVPPNTWTQVAFDMSRFSSQLVSPEGGTWDGVFSNVGHVQFGVFVPPGFSADTTAYTISIDKVALLTPEPTAALLGAVGLASIVAMRRRKVNLNAQ